MHPLRLTAAQVLSRRALHVLPDHGCARVLVKNKAVSKVVASRFAELQFHKRRLRKIYSSASKGRGWCSGSQEHQKTRSQHVLTKTRKIQRTMIIWLRDFPSSQIVTVAACFLQKHLSHESRQKSRYFFLTMPKAVKIGFRVSGIF